MMDFRLSQLDLFIEDESLLTRLNLNSSLWWCALEMAKFEKCFSSVWSLITVMTWDDALSQILADCKYTFDIFVSLHTWGAILYCIAMSLCSFFFFPLKEFEERFRWCPFSSTKTQTQNKKTFLVPCDSFFSFFTSYLWWLWETVWERRQVKDLSHLIM